MVEKAMLCDVLTPNKNKKKQKNMYMKHINYIKKTIYNIYHRIFTTMCNFYKPIKTTKTQ